VLSFVRLAGAGVVVGGKVESLAAPCVAAVLAVRVAGAGVVVRGTTPGAAFGGSFCAPMYIDRNVMPP